MRIALLKWMIETAVPVLNVFRNPSPWPFTMEQHRLMPAGSFGNDLAMFLDERKLQLLPMYEAHDATHVLLGYGTLPLDELKLQAFMVGNGSVTFAGRILFVLGLLIVPDEWPILRAELSRGKTAKRIADYKLEDFAMRKTGVVKATLGLN
jgi:hypothetical protein